MLTRLADEAYIHTKTIRLTNAKKSDTISRNERIKIGVFKELKYVLEN